MIWYRRTSLGVIGIEERNGAVTRLFFAESQPGPTDSVEKETPLVTEAFSQLESYLRGERRCFDLPLRPHGTPFMQEVWTALLAIPYGATASYKDIAEAVGKPGAARAVGQANNRNPIAIVIPCHRVVGANGKLTGYAGGLPVKQALLRLERPDLLTQSTH